MEIRHLKLIKTIVEKGTLVKASEELNLTQSALSHQLKQIEFELEIKLFNRTNRRMLLTEAGQMIYDLSIEVFEKWKRTEAEIRAMSNGKKGEISILTDCHTSYHWLPRLMKEYNQKFNNVVLKMGSQSSTNMVKNLEESADIVITPYIEKNRKLSYFPLFQDESFLAMSSDNLLARKAYVMPSDLSNQNLIIYANPIEETLTFKAILEPNKVRPKEITVVPFTEASIEMIRSDLGVGVFAKWSIENYFSDAKLAFKSIGKEGLVRQYYGAILKENEENKLLLNFIEYLKGKNRI